MLLEVELKFVVTDEAALRESLVSLGCRFLEPIEQQDLYFAHPARSFKESDEALRLRRSGQQMCITYKGPKIDRTTKTRHEIEIPFDGGDAGFEQYQNLLQALGFTPVLMVHKIRLPGVILRNGVEVEVAIDRVTGLGTFVEFEILSTIEQLEFARTTIESLAKQLDLGDSERRGYLDMLIENSSKHPTF